MKRPLLMVSLVYAAGVLVGNWISLPLACLFAISFAAAVASLASERSRGRLLWPLLALAGWTNLSSRTEILSPYDLRIGIGTNAAIVTVRGTLIDTPVERVARHGAKPTLRTLARLQVTALETNSIWHPASGQLAISTRGVLPPGFFTGRTVEVNGVVGLPKGSAAEGLFDYGAYLRRLGIHYQLEVESPNDWRPVGSGSGAEPPPLADRFRAWAQRTLARGLPEQDESLRLLWAMALGWTTALTPDVSEPFMRTGTMHIFAISGLHIALIAGILVTLLRVLRVSRGVCGWFVIPLIWFYTAATGWQASAVRSTLMMTVIIIGWALRRPSDLLNSLAAAGFIILLWDPQQLFQAGFQLSFFVVLSIALLLPPIELMRQRLLQTDPFLPPELRPRWRRLLDGPIHYLTTSIATSLAAWLGSLPLIAFYFHLFTPVSLLANLAIVPLSSLALACNLGSLLCAGWPWLGELFNFSGWFWMEAMIELSEWFATLPGAYHYVHAPSWIGFIAYYGLLFGVMTGWLRAPSRWIWAIAFGLLAAFGIIHEANHRSDTRLTVLPLNGGDSIFIDAPGRANDVMIDCGSEAAAEFVTKPYLHAHGVNQLPHLVLTHGDLHHVAGAALMKQEFSVGQIVTSSVPFRSGKYREVVDELNHSPARRREVNRGDQFGNWNVLHPAADDRFRDADDNTLVLRGTFHGVRILLCSDLGRPGQRALVEREPNLRADIVVCGIPARGEPIEDFLLDTIRPRVIIVSASEVPSRERATPPLRERLERRGIPVFYTSDDGAVTVTVQPGRCEVRAMSNKRFSSIEN